MKRALELNPSSSVLFYVYAMVLRKCGRDDEAQAMFDRALEIDPMNLVAAYQKAVLLHEAGNLSGAIDCLKKAAALVPHEPGVALLRGKIAQSLGNLAEATLWYTDALIYGHPEKKDILWAVERMSEALTRVVLEDDE
jgi:tetratricopeptide (TPR) repeat protein